MFSAEDLMHMSNAELMALTPEQCESIDADSRLGQLAYHAAMLAGYVAAKAKGLDNDACNREATRRLQAVRAALDFSMPTALEASIR